MIFAKVVRAAAVLINFSPALAQSDASGGAAARSNTPQPKGDELAATGGANNGSAGIGSSSPGEGSSSPKIGSPGLLAGSTHSKK